jgi:hypothetical protein
MILGLALIVVPETMECGVADPEGGTEFMLGVEVALDELAVDTENLVVLELVVVEKEPIEAATGSAR